MTLPARKSSEVSRSVTLLGATGSIGKSALRVIDASPERFSVRAVTAMDNVETLAALAKHHHVQFAAIGNPAHYNALKAALSGTNIRTGAGEEALLEATSIPSDVVLSAIVGAAGLAPTLAAIQRGAHIALANKESLVMAGALVMQAAARAGAMLIPVDSEHNAIFQVFDAKSPEYVKRVTITASGGPFRTFTYEQMKSVTPAQAVAHPNWSMGAKISVDSATMMNKGLELIEALHLFPIASEQLEVLVHPESIVHSLVEYIDGSVLAQMSCPDMATPIAHALSYPARITAPVPRLNLAEIGKLSFEAPDHARFPALALAREVFARGGCAPAVLNAANEVAVNAFLNNRLAFTDIVPAVERTLGTASLSQANSLSDIVAADAHAREITNAFIQA